MRPAHLVARQVEALLDAGCALPGRDALQFLPGVQLEAGLLLRVKLHAHPAGRVALQARATGGFGGGERRRLRVDRRRTVDGRAGL
jgi:hypothetical protein